MVDYVTRIETGLLPALRIESVHPNEPVVAHVIPAPWSFVGAGNYTVVLAHPAFPDRVVKVYAPGRPGLEEEVEVYRRLGVHPAFSRCLAAGEGYLVLKRLRGNTFYDCLRRGLPIPERAVRDIDEALDYARCRALNPHDVHAKNVMISEEGRGLVADVSDFLAEREDAKWDDLRRAYYRFYRPLLARRPIPVPDFVLNLIRKGYRVFRGHLDSSDQVC